MSLRRRKRLQNLTANESVTAPRKARTFLPSEPLGVRVRNPVPDNSGLRHSAMRRISPEKPNNRLSDTLVHLRRLHINHELYHGIKPTYERLDYPVRRVNNVEEVTLPLDHPLCKERRERKEVLFAKRKAGRGSGRQRPPKDPGIIIKCK